MKRWCFAYCAKMFVGFVLCTLALGVAVMLLWNWLIPVIFTGGPEINYLQALGVLVLSRILIGFRGGWSRCSCSTSENSKGDWRKKWEDKISRLSPEEREKMKESYKKCCGSSNIED